MTHEQITEEQTKQFIKDDPKAFVHILKDKIIPEVQGLLTALNETNECKQFEICLMDIQSIGDHLTDYLTAGPAAPFVKVKLEDSEIPADHPDNLMPFSVDHPETANEKLAEDK